MSFRVAYLKLYSLKVISVFKINLGSFTRHDQNQKRNTDSINFRILQISKLPLIHNKWY